MPLKMTRFLSLAIIYYVRGLKMFIYRLGKHILVWDKLKYCFSINLEDKVWKTI